MHKNNYALEVLVNNRPMAEYYSNGNTLIEAREGTEYTLRLKNNSWKRVLAVLSVDGVEVIGGKAAAESNNGYIVDAYSSIDIKGYRVDDENVAAFKFAGGKLSYAATVGATIVVNEATGETEQKVTEKNNGVIGVRVFEEDTASHDYKEAYKTLPPPVYPNGVNAMVSGSAASSGRRARVFYSTQGVFASPSPASGYSTCVTGCAGSLVKVVTGSLSMGGGYISNFTPMTRQNVNQMGQLSSVNQYITEPPEGCDNVSMSFCATTAAVAPGFDLGTTWGAKVADKVKEVAFKKVAEFTEIIIFYASRASLEEYGIDFSRTKQIFTWPAAFEDKKQYCIKPAGWTGGAK